MNHDYTTMIWSPDISVKVRLIVDPNDPSKSSVAVHINRFEGAGWVPVPQDCIDHYGVHVRHREPWGWERESRRFTD